MLELTAGQFLYTKRARIIEFATRNRLPTVYGHRERS